MIERVVNGALALVLGGATVFATTALGAAVDAANPVGVILAGFLVLCGGGATLFFARDVVRREPDPDAEEQEREAWDYLYEIPPGYRRVHGQPESPFDLDVRR